MDEIINTIKKLIYIFNHRKKLLANAFGKVYKKIYNVSTLNARCTAQLFIKTIFSKNWRDKDVKLN